MKNEIEYNTAIELLDAHIEALKDVKDENFDQNTYLVPSVDSYACCVMRHHDSKFGEANHDRNELLGSSEWDYLFGNIDNILFTIDKYNYPNLGTKTVADAIARLNYIKFKYEKTRNSKTKKE